MRATMQSTHALKVALGLAPEKNPMQYCQYKGNCRLQLHLSGHLNPLHPASAAACCLAGAVHRASALPFWVGGAVHRALSRSQWPPLTPGCLLPGTCFALRRAWFILFTGLPFAHVCTFSLVAERRHCSRII